MTSAMHMRAYRHIWLTPLLALSKLHYTVCNISLSIATSAFKSFSNHLLPNYSGIFIPTQIKVEIASGVIVFALTRLTFSFKMVYPSSGKLVRTNGLRPMRISPGPMLIDLLALLKSMLQLNRLDRLSGLNTSALSSINSFLRQLFSKLTLPPLKLSSTARRDAPSSAILTLHKNGAFFFVNPSCLGLYMCQGTLTILTSAQRFKGLNLFLFLATACSSSSTLPLTLTHVGLHGLIEKSTSYTTLGAFQFLPAMPQRIVYTLPHIECYTCCRIVYTLPKIECYTSSRIVYTLPKIGCYATVFFWPSLLWPVFYHTFFPSLLSCHFQPKVLSFIWEGETTQPSFTSFTPSSCCS